MLVLGIGVPVVPVDIVIPLDPVDPVVAVLDVVVVSRARRKASKT